MPSALPMRFYDNTALFTLQVAGKDGQLLGYLAGEPIFESVYDPTGRRYDFVGAAPRLRSGKVDLAAFRENQWLVEPGLIYQWDGNDRRTPESHRAR